jgi:hypothetical protein
MTVFFQITLFLSFYSEQGTPMLLLEKQNQAITTIFQPFQFYVKFVTLNRMKIWLLSQN